MKKSTSIFGFIAAFILLAGVIFKSQHWPGSGVMIVVGCVLLSFVYSIMLFIEKLRMAELSFPKFMALWVLVLMIVIPTSFMFKFMHWPGGGILFITSNLLLLISIPIIIIHAVKTKDSVKKLNFHNEAILFIVLCAFSYAMSFLTISKKVLDSFATGNETVVKVTKYHESKCNEIFKNIESAAKGSAAGTNYLEKAKEVKMASDTICDFIVSIEKAMVTESGQTDFNPDSLGLIYAKDSRDIPSHFMLTENGATKLKEKLIKYKEIIDMNTNGRGKEIITLFFNTDDPKPVEEGVVYTWEIANFDRQLLIVTLCRLNQIISNVRLLEDETLIYLQAMTANAINKETAFQNNNKKEDKKH
jgi:hypothetical protein